MTGTTQNSRKIQESKNLDIDVQNTSTSGQGTINDTSENNKTGARSSIKSFISGGVGGMCLVAAGHPLDLIKVRLQATSGVYSGMLDCARQTIAREGIRGLYRGMMAPLAGVTPVFSVCFWGYDVGSRIARNLDTRTRIQEPETSAPTPLALWQVGIAGALSAVPTTALMAPMERVKCMMQVSSTTNSSNNRKPAPAAGPIATARSIIAAGGTRALFTGATATLLRDGIGSVGYFVAYEGIKRELTKSMASGDTSGGKKQQQLSPAAVLVAGGAAGMANWALAIPFDVLKSRQQTAPPGTYSGLRDVFVKTVSKEGPGALLTGLGPAMVRAFPANAACFLGVETTNRVLDSLW